MNIGIIGAMKEEISPLLEMYGTYESINFGNNTYYKVRYNNINIFIAYSKIGKVHAAISATSMITAFDCKYIIFSGVAGGLSSGLNIGDLLLATKLCQHDVDISAFGHPLGFIPEGKIFYESDKTLRDLAKQVANDMSINIHEGIIASGDAFIADKNKKDFITKEFGAIAVEMEGASVACVCYNFDIPYCIFRSISDNADGGANVSFDTFLESSAKISAGFVKKLVDKIIANKQ